MQTIELLAPAGDQESLIAAIQNGANAIYLGGTLFNARAFAKNFDKQQLKWAIEYAHLRSVKIYVTVNVLYQDSEFEALMQYIDYLYDIQIDALIIQDIGLFQCVRKRYPDFELHISTQASVMNSYGVQFFEQLGASRVVLARENNLNEITKICHSTSLQIEVFVHGALCICYSGQCLMSSLIGQRSGNRGACAQPCRLQYRLQQNGRLLKNNVPFLLSPKDLITIEQIGELIKAGVTSFKIEGRMKRPEYVACVTRAYRKAIDASYNKEKTNLDKDIAYMRAMFNRNYTKGYAFSDDHLVDGDYSGNKGVIIGKVVNYNQKRKTITCQLTASLKQGDGIVFENIDKGRPVNKIFLKNRLISQAEKGDTVEIEFDYPVYDGHIRKTVDTDVIDQLKKTYQKENIKQNIEMQFIAKENEKAYLKIKYKDFIIEKETQFVLKKALHTSLNQERIIQQLSKLGGTCFIASKINITMDRNISISIKEMNELRRVAIEELSSQIINKKIHINKKFELPALQSREGTGKYQTIVLVSSLQQLKSIMSCSLEVIYYPFQADINEAFELCHNAHKELGLFFPRICKDSELEKILKHPIYQKITKVIVNDYGAYHACQGKEIIIGTGLHIYNSYASSFYNHYKILSLEMTQKQIQSLHTNHQQCLMQVYGKIENMISEYCPISQYYFGIQKKNCGLCKKNQYSLIDRKNEKFDLMMDEHCRMHLLNSRTLFIDNLQKINIQGVFVHFTNEDKDQTKEIMNDLFKVINHRQKSNCKSQMHTTLGYFRR